MEAVGGGGGWHCSAGLSCMVVILHPLLHRNFGLTQVVLRGDKFVLSSNVSETEQF